MLELDRRLTAKQAAFAAQPVFQFADLLELHHQLLKIFFRLGVFERVRSKLFDGFAGFARQIVEKLFLLLDVVSRLIHLFEGLALLIDDRIELVLHLIHRRLQAVLVIELAHLARHLRQEIFEPFGLLLAVFDALLHQAAHRLLQIAGVVHVVVQLIEYGIGVERIPLSTIPAAVTDMDHWLRLKSLVRKNGKATCRT